MWSLREYQRRPTQLADFLPWAALVGPGLVLNKDGSFQRTARFRGADLDSATDAELASVALRLNSILRRLGSGWALYVEAQRNVACVYPESEFPDPVSALVEAERRAAFEAQGAHFDSAYFLTFQHLPPAEQAGALERLLYEGRARATADWRETLAAFADQTERLLGLMEGLLPELAWLSDAETLGYLHSTVSTGRHRVQPPQTPMQLDALLADQPLTGGLAPRLGAAHLRVLTLSGFPSSTWPGLLDDLNRLAFPYRWVTRAICLDKLAAVQLASRVRRQWFSKRKSLAAILKEVLTSEASALVDSDAENKAAEADAALQDLGGDVAGHAFITASVVVWDEDADIAEARLRQVEKTIQASDFTCVLERTNAVEAWLGGLPGHAYANVRRPPISTLNLAHIIPVSAVWAGPERNDHLDGPPLLLARTDGCTPFRFSPHVGDVGHTLVLGPTGAGKSVLLALMALQFRRYGGAQTIAFDFGRSLRAATLGVGGVHHDLGDMLERERAGRGALQPLAACDDVAERAWAADWLAALLAREHVLLDPEDRAHLWSALTSLASAPAAERTLSGLAALLQSARLKQALTPYTLAGPWGGLLDGDHEHLGTASATCFETKGVIGSSAAPAVLSYLFHRIGDRLDGRPTLILVDEGWLVLDDPLFGAQLREWLKTLRKCNASVVFASQSLADVEASAIAPAIIESCPTRLFLPNDRALEPQIAGAYARFGLNSRQIEILSQARPQRDYYCQSRQGQRLFELGLGDVALAFCAAASPADQHAIDEILDATRPEAFAAKWLARRGLAWAAELVASPTAAAWEDIS